MTYENVAVLSNEPALHFEDEAPYNHNVYRSKVDGSYICFEGNTRQLDFLTKRGISLIQNATRERERSSNIGFSETEQKWYGWSHRAIFGFGVGSEVKKGNCAFIPSNKAEDIESILSFWIDEYQLKATHIEATNEEGQDGVQMTWEYSSKIPNEDLRGTIGGQFAPFYSNYKEYGKGEWVAQSLEDAKQMAIDFANGVS